jgi:hypothetical protein
MPSNLGLLFFLTTASLFCFMFGLARELGAKANGPLHPVDCISMGEFFKRAM